VHPSACPDPAIIHSAAIQHKAGDISARLKLKEQLQCKEFKYFLDRLMPDMFIPRSATALIAATLTQSQ
jgi:hypothetical protein